MTWARMPRSRARPTAIAAPTAGAKSRGDFGGHQRGNHVASARANGPGVEATRHRRQQADVGEGRVAPANAGVMVEDGDAVCIKQRAQAVGLARDRRLGDAEEQLGHAASPGPPL